MMDEGGFQAAYEATLRAARRIPIHDPAIDAEDVAQEAWLRSARWLDGNRSRDEQVAYLRAAARAVAIDHIRRVRRRGGAAVCLDAPQRTADGEGWSAPGELIPAPISVEDAALARADLAEIVGAAVKGNAMALTALLLGLGHTAGEIAAATGVARVTVSTRALRWRAAHGGMLA